MVEIGKVNKLRVNRITPQGAHLNGGDLGEIILPTELVSEKCQKGDRLTVFIYNNPEGELAATTKRPYAQVGEFAHLNVVACTPQGAYLDWGLDKDLLVPFSEQIHPMEVNRRYLVRIFLDESSERLAASGRLDDFLDITDGAYKEGQAVDLLIAGRTELGFKVIVNTFHWGVIYYDQVFKQFKVGEKLPGFISKVRADGKLDLTLEAPGYNKVTDFSDTLLDAIKENDGFMMVSDKSSPELIKRLFGVSKAVFKKAVGKLYKQELISLQNGGLKLK